MMNRSTSRYDAVLVGGGPAGATAARLLARWGHRVLVLTRERPPRTAIAESLPPSCRRLFRHLDIEGAIDGAGFQATTGNTVWWGDETPRLERFPDGATGHQVSSVQLERLLLDLAEAAGAQVRRSCRVREVRPHEPVGADDPARAEGGAPPDGATVLVEGGGEGESISAPWVLDASGRAGVLGRAFRRRVEGRETLALHAGYESSRWGLEDPSHTLVESYADGWAWSVPLSATTRFLAVMVDPRRTDLDPTPHRATLFAAELAKTRFLRRLVENARPAGTVRACDASSYTANRFCGGGFFLLGDAGSFIDPLSSYGVKKAMTSGWLAAVCVNTCLRRPELTRHALDLYERRERQVFDSYSRLSAGYSSAAGVEHVSAFWSARAGLDDGVERANGSELDPSRLGRDPAVRSCFDALRRLEKLALRRGPEVGIEPRPIVAGREIVLADHLVGPWAPHGVRFLRGVDLTRLVSLAPRARTVPDLVEAYNRSGVSAALPDLLSSLAVCLAKGILTQGPRGLTPSASD